MCSREQLVKEVSPSSYRGRGKREDENYQLLDSLPQCRLGKPVGFFNLCQLCTVPKEDLCQLRIARVQQIATTLPPSFQVPPFVRACGDGGIEARYVHSTSCQGNLQQVTCGWFALPLFCLSKVTGTGRCSAPKCWLQPFECLAFNLKGLDTM